MIRDPLDENVIPVVEELQRRLPLAIGRGEGEDYELPEAQTEDDSDEETGTPCLLKFYLQISVFFLLIILFFTCSYNRILKIAEIDDNLFITSASYSNAY